MMKQKKKQLATAGEVFRVYFSYVKKTPVLLTLIIVGIFVAQAALLTGPWFVRQFINTIATHTPDRTLRPQLVGFLLLVLASYLIEWIARRISTWANSKLQSTIMAALIVDSFSYLLQHSHNFFISRFAGSLTHKVSKFSRAFETLFDTIIQSFAPTLFFVVGAISILGSRNKSLGIILAVWTICFILFQWYVSMLRQPLRVKRSEADTAVTASLADAISNHSTISLFGHRVFEVSQLRKVVEQWRSITLRTWTTDEWTWAGIGLFMMGIEVGLLYVGVTLWEQGLIVVGDFLLIQLYLFATFDRLVGINRELRRFYDAFADASEMVALLHLPLEIQNVKNAKDLHISKGEIVFDAVKFYFNPEKPILQNLQVRLLPGQKVALVGPSGAGKSTITKLLLRLYDVSSGSISIDGQNIAAVAQDSLRSGISFVPQEPILFHRTLMENIRYGRLDATDAEVFAAAKGAHCDEFISHLPERYDTFVGERGVKLSGGERQRVAIARAILKNAPILVLDEATSSLDSESESLIQDALKVLMQNKTVIVIAHRLSTIMNMDRILVIEGGSVVADGTHDTLIEEGGLYKKLWSIQAGGFISEEKEAENTIEDEFEGNSFEQEEIDLDGHEEEEDDAIDEKEKNTLV